MNSQAPTLFDDFFLQDDESSQQNKSSKKTTRKKKLDTSLSLFELETDSDTSSIQPTEEISQDEQTLVSEVNDLIAENDNVIDEKIDEQLKLSNDVAKETIDESENQKNEVESESIQDKEINEEDKKDEVSIDQHLDTNDDLKILENQYFEAIGSYGIGKDFFLSEDEMVNDSLEKENDIQKEVVIESNDDIETDTIDSFQPEDWNLTKHYYSIGEVANMFGVNISHIRFWTNEFRLKPRTNKKGNRYYTPSQIETLQLIHYLVKVKKHTIKGAQEKLKVQKKLVQNNMQLKDSLIDLKSKLEELKNHF